MCSLTPPAFYTLSDILYFLQQACEWDLNTLRRKMLKYTVTLNNYFLFIIPQNYSCKS